MSELKPRVIGEHMQYSGVAFRGDAQRHLQHRLNMRIIDETKDLPSFLVMRSSVRSIPDSPFRRVEQRALVMEFGWKQITTDGPLFQAACREHVFIVAKFKGNAIVKAKLVFQVLASASVTATGKLPDAMTPVFSFPEWTHWMRLPPSLFVGELLDHAASAKEVASYVGGEAVESP